MKKYFTNKTKEIIILMLIFAHYLIKITPTSSGCHCDHCPLCIRINERTVPHIDLVDKLERLIACCWLSISIVIHSAPSTVCAMGKAIVPCSGFNIILIFAKFRWNVVTRELQTGLPRWAIKMTPLINNKNITWSSEGDIVRVFIDGDTSSSFRYPLRWNID